MKAFSTTTPVMMSLSSHDPSGSSGIQADIETAASLGCHAAPVITALCASDTRETQESHPIDSRLLIQQARAILEDMPVTAIKLGFLGSVENVEAIHSILRDYPKIPVVIDPISAVCPRSSLQSEGVIQALQALLLPLSTLVTADIVEAHDLAQQGDTLDACAQEILETGCQYLLVSGARRTHEHYENHFYDDRGMRQVFSWERLNQFSHGSGSTLSASIASYLAHGLRIQDSIAQGQRFTWLALANSRRLGQGKRIPNRFFWTEQDNHSGRH